MGSINVRRIKSILDDLEAHAGLLENDPHADRKGTIRIMMALADALKASLAAELELEERISPAVQQAPKVVPPAPKLAPPAGNPTRRGEPWSADEDSRLVRAFDAGATQKQLAERHGRSPGAIRSRLEKIGKLEHLDAAE